MAPRKTRNSKKSRSRANQGKDSRPSGKRHHCYDADLRTWAPKKKLAAPIDSSELDLRRDWHAYRTEHGRLMSLVKLPTEDRVRKLKKFRYRKKFAAAWWRGSHIASFVYGPSCGTDAFLKMDTRKQIANTNGFLQSRLCESDVYDTVVKCHPHLKVNDRGRRIRKSMGPTMRPSLKSVEVNYDLDHTFYVDDHGRIIVVFYGFLEESLNRAMRGYDYFMNLLGEGLQ